MCPGDSRSFGPAKFALLSSLSKPLLYFFAGGQKNRGDRIRTCDFLVPNQAL